MKNKTRYLKLSVDEMGLERAESDLETEVGWLHETIIVEGEIVLKEGEELIRKRRDGTMETIGVYETEGLGEELNREIEYYVTEVRCFEEEEREYVREQIEGDLKEIGELIEGEVKEEVQKLFINRLIAEG